MKLILVVITILLLGFLSATLAHQHASTYCGQCRCYDEEMICQAITKTDFQVFIEREYERLGVSTIHILHSHFALKRSWKKTFLPYSRVVGVPLIDDEEIGAPLIDDKATSTSIPTTKDGFWANKKSATTPYTTESTTTTQNGSDIFWLPKHRRDPVMPHHVRVRSTTTTLNPKVYTTENSTDMTDSDFTSPTITDTPSTDIATDTELYIQLWPLYAVTVVVGLICLFMLSRRRFLRLLCRCLYRDTYVASANVILKDIASIEDLSSDSEEEEIFDRGRDRKPKKEQAEIVHPPPAGKQSDNSKIIRRNSPAPNRTLEVHEVQVEAQVHGYDNALVQGAEGGFKTVGLCVPHDHDRIEEVDEI